ncbi:MULTISPECIES: ABC transporter permease [Xanthomonas]|uniref:ABC transporter permease n=1 Tax=Xanthomonas TaxID=338 RepID=UPI00137B2962|nr:MULTISPECIES: ABC transporter permease [Xanthomonas]
MIDGKGPIRDLILNFSLVSRLTRRDVRGRYQGSTFGVLWSLATPLMLLLAYWFVLGFVLQAKFGMAPQKMYPIILFSGLIIHLFFAEVIGRSSGLIFEHRTYVKKVVFPLTVLPWMTLGTATFHLLVNITILLIGQILIAGSLPPTWPLLFLVILPLFPIMLGLAWFLSALSVFLRDIQQIVPLALTLMMFLSPIFVPIEMVPAKYVAFIYLNPISIIVVSVRDVIITGRQPDFWMLALYTAVSILVMLLGYAFFCKTRRGFADVL